MLTHLKVENYALIESLEIAFDAHLNIITGETGAGKSILMGALGLLLGAKGDATAIKDTTRNCTVEGIFDLQGLELADFFEQNDIEYDDTTVINRLISASGKSRAFINDQPVQLGVLRELGSRLIDIHSQHQNLILQSSKFRLQALDTFAANGDILASYTAAYGELTRLRTELAQIEAASTASHDNEEWLRYQVDELQAASLKEGETAELEQQQLTLENAETIHDTLCSTDTALSNDESGILPTLKQLALGMEHIRASYPQAQEFTERMRSAMLDLKDISDTLQSDIERIDADPKQLEKINERLNTLYTLCQKHKVQTVDELIAVRDRYADQLAKIVFGDEHIAALKEKITTAEQRCNTLADKLHASRSKAAPKFATEILATLRQLGMEEAQFQIRLAAVALCQSGKDEAEYLFASGSRMEPQAVERIASGGELSRVMLSLKALMARNMALPTIIFDEIDTGVSGRIADAMGDIISRLAETMQVVNITHLPQVASKGNSHLVVYKSDGQTHIRPLTAAERVDEVAKMLSGSTVTDAALAQAKILLGQQ